MLSHADVEDDQYTLLSSRLEQYASLHINVQALRTGYSKDLSGEVSVSCFSRFIYLMDFMCVISYFFPKLQHSSAVSDHTLVSYSGAD